MLGRTPKCCGLEHHVYKNYFFWADQKQRKAKLWNMAHKEPEPPLTKTFEQMLTHRLGPVMVKWWFGARCFGILGMPVVNWNPLPRGIMRVQTYQAIWLKNCRCGAFPFQLVVTWMTGPDSSASRWKISWEGRLKISKCWWGWMESTGKLASKNPDAASLPDSCPNYAPTARKASGSLVV